MCKDARSFEDVRDKWKTLDLKIKDCYINLNKAEWDFGSLIIKQTYNKRHSSVRVVVEQIIELLKGRFHRLKYLDMENIAAMSKVVMTACILHNLCIEKGEKDISEDILLDNCNDDDGDNFPENTQNRAAAIEKRNRIADFLMEK
ncbi:uncharacterized protein LOC111615121 [Centruroides sculpturatus]|uniref:uncharacterized protein LOC111615121 n=1 Tax=Centruroides sculpturatus TaxID=218467 RepID=UPI000C6D77F9|nr:uncharacterized protein LOC111615121 [Centruroides sculpturatus]